MATAVLAGTAVAGLGYQAYSSYASGTAQEKAARRARDAQLKQAGLLREAGSAAQDEFRAGGRRALGNIYAAGRNAGKFLNTGFDEQGNFIGQGFDEAGGVQRQAFGQAGKIGLEGAQLAQRSLQQGESGALSQLSGLGGDLRGQLEETRNRGFSGFEQDPGFQFRQQQGEQAINRAAAASGGRLSGRTLKELGSFNQGLASQEFQNFANRRLQQQQQLLSGSQALSAQELSAAGQRANITQSSQTNLANLATGTAANQQGLALNRGTTLSGLALDRAGALSDLSGNKATTLANLETSQGNQLANTNLATAAGVAGAGLQGAGSAASIAANAIQGPVQLAGQAQANLGQNIANTAGDIAYLGLTQLRQPAAAPAAAPATAPVQPYAPAIGRGSSIAAGGR